MVGELLAYVQRFSLKAKRVIYGYMIYELSDHLSKVVIFYLRRDEMRKFILTILLIMSLYCPKVNATPILNLQQQTTSSKIDELFITLVEPEYLTIEQVKFMSNNVEKYSKDQSISSKYFRFNVSGWSSFMRGFMYGIVDSSLIFVEMSEKERNCMERPPEMFLDEILARYNNKEISKDDNFKGVLLEQILNCSEDKKVKIHGTIKRLLSKEMFK